MSLEPLVGRDAALASITEAFEDGRIVTVLGPPGIGKTTVAERWAALHARSFAGGAFACDLSEIRSCEGLERAVTSVVRGPRTVLGDDTRDVRAALFARGSMLLLLDNFEQLVASADEVRRWCESAPHLHVLVTSRERLAIAGERVVELGPLGCPPSEAEPEEILASDAVRLFVLRARAVGGAVGDDPRVLGELVHRLDGIPLAIELAAGHTRLFTPQELTERLGERFRLLTRRPRLGDRRRSTLASSIDWSWDLLGAAERKALAESSVFAGSFCVEAAEQVISPSEDLPAALLGALRDKSLIHSEREGRLALYASIREYAAGKLVSMGAATVYDARLRHARYFAGRARAFNVTRTYHGALPDSNLRVELSADRDNLLAALTFARDLVDPLLTGELACAVTLLQAAPGDYCDRWLTQALESLDERRSEYLRERILLARLGVRNSMGRLDDGNRDLETLLATRNLPAGMRALALLMRGIQLRYRSLYRSALESHLLAARELEVLDLPRMEALNTACMGRLYCDLGDAGRGRLTNARARAICNDIGDRWLEALALGNVAQLEQELGDFDASARLFELSLERFREASEPLYVAAYCAAYGDMLFEAGKIAEAREYYREAAEFFDGWGGHRVGVLLHGAWSALEAQHGDLREAELHLGRARRTAERGGSSTVRLALGLHEGCLALALARNADALVRERERLSVWARALREGGPGAAPEDQEVVRCSLEARFALRVLERALHQQAGQAARLLRVAPNGAWFAAGDAPPVDLRRRGSMRRLLLALVRERERAPDTPLSREQLLQAGWPGERLLPEAASNRLRVAIATLRRIGLREFLITRDDGYLLDPEAQLSVVTAADKN